MIRAVKTIIKGYNSEDKAMMRAGFERFDKAFLILKAVLVTLWIISICIIFFFEKFYGIFS